MKIEAKSKTIPEQNHSTKLTKSCKLGFSRGTVAKSSELNCKTKCEYICGVNVKELEELFSTRAHALFSAQVPLYI